MYQQFSKAAEVAVHFRGPVFKNATKIPREDTREREREKERNGPASGARGSGVEWSRGSKPTTTTPTTTHFKTKHLKTKHINTTQ